MIQLFAKNINNQWVQLDLIETEPVKLNLAVASVEDPTISVSNYSQDFTIPGTGKNTQFFRGAFNVNATDFDATRKTKAYLTNDGVLVAWGNIRLNSIESNLKDELYFYNLQFFGETSDFASSVGGRNLSDLNLSHLNHGLSYSTITNSWLPATGGSDPITNGAIRYPLADWGYLYTTSGVTQPTVPTVSIGGIKSFTSSSNALALNQMKPMIQAKQIWDAIFNEAGFSYSSSFLNSDLFKNLYVMVDSQPRYAMNISSDCTVQAPNINIAPNTEIKINFSNIIAGNPSAFNLNNDSFTMSVDSGVNFEINTSVSAGVLGDSGSSTGCSITLELNVFDETDNTIAWSDSQNFTLDPIADCGTGYVVWGVFSEVVNKVGSFSGIEGHRYILRTNLNMISPYNIAGGSSWSCTSPFPTPITQPNLFNTTWEINQLIEYVVPGSLLSTTFKNIDFIKSIMNKFRLIFVPDKLISNRFNIEPWTDWIKSGVQKDWSNKLDVSKSIVTTHLFYSQSRELEFRDQEDTDYVNYSYQQNVKFPFGRLKLDSDIDVISGTKTISTSFAPTPMDFLPGSDSVVIPHFSKLTPGSNGGVNKFEPISPKVRLLFWNGLFESPFTWYLQTDTVPAAQSFIPQASPFSTWPVGPTSIDINWFSTDPVYGIGVFPNTQSANTSFTEYWEKWYDFTYDPYSRTATAYLKLDQNDINDFNFNDRIWIRDTWWYVTKIENFEIGKINNVKVQLVKYKSIGAEGNNISYSNSFFYWGTVFKCIGGEITSIGLGILKSDKPLQLFPTPLRYYLVSEDSTILILPEAIRPPSSSFYTTTSIDYITDPGSFC